MRKYPKIAEDGPLYRARNNLVGAEWAGDNFDSLPACEFSPLGLRSGPFHVFRCPLAPLQIIRGLLPLVVGRAGANQVQVGAEVAAARAFLVAEALRLQAERARFNHFSARPHPGEKVLRFRSRRLINRSGLF